MHRRLAAIACGGFDRALRRLEDWDFLLRLTATKAPLFVPVVLSHYRVNEESAAQRAQHEAAWRRIIGRRAAVPSAFQFGDDATVLFAPPAPPRPPAGGVSIVIPSLDIPDTLALCVARVMATVDPARVEVIICDNGSGPPTLARLRELQAKYPALLVEYLADNQGFTHAVNHGIALARPDNHIVLLNNDAIVMDGWLEALLDAVAQHSQAGIVAPRQMLLPGTPTIAMHAPAANVHLETDVSLSAHHANVIATAPARPDGIVELNFVPFFCVLLTRSLLNALGPLDERRGRHYRSDSLYCLAAREVAGLRILYTPHAKVYHLLQQSTHALRQTRPDAYREMLETNRRPGQQEPWDIL
jgi:GT2 family glycosyltransferase